MIHFTPSFAHQSRHNFSDNYLPYNKPFGVKHWLNATRDTLNETIIVLADYDTILFKPFSINSGTHDLRYGGSRDLMTVTDTVKPGQAMSADWSMFLKAGVWNKPEKLAILCKDKPCMNVSKADASEYYTPTGPPYIMHINDMRDFIQDYCDFAIHHREIDRGWMSEMHAFALAAANNDIKFTVLADLGITVPQERNPRMYWSFVDDLTQNPCLDSVTSITNEELSLDMLPTAIHMCKKYPGIMLGNLTYSYYKYHLPRNVMQCQGPLLKMPPSEIWDVADTQVNRRDARAGAWVQCTVIRYINSVLKPYKRASCPNGYNLEKTFPMLDPMYSE